MRILKNFILILCVISFFNFGEIKKIRAMEAFLPQKQANVAFLGFPKSGKTVLKTALEDNFQAKCQSILPFGDCTIKLNFWDVFDEPEKGDIDDKYARMDVVIITVALNDLSKDWKKVIRKNLLEWQHKILNMNPNAKIILACTKTDTIIDNEQLNNISMSIDNFVSADRDLGGSIQSVMVSVTDTDSLETLMDTIRQDLRNIDIDLLHDVNDEIFPIPPQPKSGICFVL